MWLKEPGNMLDVLWQVRQMLLSLTVGSVMKYISRAILHLCFAAEYFHIFVDWFNNA